MKLNWEFGYIKQYAAAFSGTLLILSGAIAFGWTSPTLPKLLADDSPLPITDDESSWIVSILALGSILGPLPTIWLVDKFGRKITLLLGAIPLIVGWILILIADSVEVVYVARMLAGLTYGMAYSATPMYLGEISSDAIRGSIGTLLTVMAKTGILYVYAIGPYVSFNLLAWLCLIPPIMFLMTFIWLPETPYFLLAKNRQETAFKNLKWLRGHDNVQTELERMDVAVKKAQENRGTFKELFTKGNRRSLIIVLGLAACQQLCGSQAVIAYSQKIFEEVGSDLGGSEAAIIMGVVQLITAAFSSSIVDRLGRRSLLLISTTGATICNAIVGLYFFLVYMDIDMSNISWLPIASIMIFIVSYTIGLATVPFALLAELFPTNVKAVASAAYTIFAGSIAFGVSKLYQVVADGIGTYVAFWGFTVFTFLFVIFVWYLVPETKGKPLDVILEEMKASRKKIPKTDQKIIL